MSPSGALAPPPAATRRWLSRALRAGKLVRDGWLILGVALLLLLAVEGVYRAQAAVRRLLAPAARGSDIVIPPGHPYADSSWFPAFLAERYHLRFRWEPFVYTRLGAFRGRYLNVGDDGLRIVPKVQSPGGRPIRIFFFGGSTTWGWYDRDSTTRPAYVARRLAAAGYDPAVVNFAQTGYVSDQELLTLVRELTRGDVPDVVIFWDGVNDILAERHNGRPGLSLREAERDSDAAFNTRRRVTGSVGDAGALRSLARHSALLAYLLAATARRVAIPPPPDPVAFCRDVVGHWLGEVRLVEALGRSYGFVPLMVWQPQWTPSQRPRSAYERYEAQREGALAPEEIGLEPHARECARVADSLAGTRPGSIVSWGAFHAADTASVFLDQYSHGTEHATAVEADSLTALILRRLPARLASPPRPGP